jgi:hypothetical protein
MLHQYRLAEYPTFGESSGYRLPTPIDISTVALMAPPNPFPKTQEEQIAEARAARDAQIQAQRAATNTAMQPLVAKMTACQAR